jgi:hypothetical protein
MGSARALKFLIRLSGGGALLLGLTLWAGYLFTWLPVHIVFGATLVLAMWVIAALASRAGMRRGFSAVVFLWGIGVIIFGRAQGRILPGPMHWTVRLAHFLAGGIAMALGVALSAAVERSAGERVS